jgi:hypothetical protein
MIEKSAPPVAVGALGGSGTRVFARVLMGMGYYLGSWRTEADDNLLVSEMLKDPEAAAPGRYDQARNVARFVRTMQGGLPGPADVAMVAEARRVCGKAAGPRQVAAVWRRVWQVAWGARQGRHIGWGWKEPFSHLFLDEFARQVPDLHYVHVIRHGLDMAFSANRAQLHSFGPRFDVRMPADPRDVPVAQLRLWVATTRHVLDVGPKLFGDRFLLMRYDDLVTSPEAEIRRLGDFLGIEGVPAEELAQGIEPTSIGRYRSEDLSAFPAELLAQVEAQGFTIA